LLRIPVPFTIVPGGGARDPLFHLVIWPLPFQTEYHSSFVPFPSLKGRASIGPTRNPILRSGPVTLLREPIKASFSLIPLYQVSCPLTFIFLLLALPSVFSPPFPFGEKRADFSYCDVLLERCGPVRVVSHFHLDSLWE